MFYGDFSRKGAKAQRENTNARRCSVLAFLCALAPLREILCCTLGAAICLAASLPVQAAAPSRLTATCYGAAGQVSGSLHMLDTGNGRWMIDCGEVIESRRTASTADGTPAEGQDGKNIPQILPAGVESAAAVFLTHAHADHLGRLPLLVDRGYVGPIYMTEATASLAVPALRVLLRSDRATVRHWAWSKDARARAETRRKALYVHWRECQYCREIPAGNMERATCSTQELFDRFGGRTPPIKVALCSECLGEQIAAVLRHARPVKYDVATDVAPGVRVTFVDAGHIPGSASILFEVTLGGKTRRVLFSGDLGNGLSPLLPPPQPAPAVDAVLVDTTYGPISRKAAVKEQPAAFRRAVAEAVRQGGVTWIPCFALDRTQKILYELHVAQRETLLTQPVPIYCPSPTAKEMTVLYRAHRDGWFSPAIAADTDAFSPRDIHTTVPSAKRLPRPCIILSTGDLVVALWMRQLLSTLLPEPSTNILLVAYQQSGSAGDLLLHGAKELDIDGQSVPVRAKVQAFSCFSGHADASQVDAWLGNVSKQAAVILIHGDKEELDARAEQLQRQGRRVIVAQPGVVMDLER
jgi:metallo-beta-lactamase family protein